MIRVGVNGYGVIGRRIADAVAAQPDMKLIGVVKGFHPDYKARVAQERGYRLFTPDAKTRTKFEAAGLPVAGTLPDLLGSVDVIVDATPEEVGAANKALYSEARTRAIFQGGEEHDIAGVSFVAQCNYDAARRKQFVRVVSCNTTALCRAVWALDQGFGVARARVVIARRAADPDEPKKGPIDAVALDPVHIPSHHGPDVMTVLPHIPVISMAIKVPTTHMHLHSLIVSLKRKDATADRVVAAFADAPRIVLIDSAHGFTSTAHVMDYARELGRPRGDLYEAVVWKDSVRVEDGEAYFYMGVHQEAIVVPEDVDAIRAVMDAASREESMTRTNSSLGIRDGGRIGLAARAPVAHS